jgi:biopolymer transport protein ExbD
MARKAPNINAGSMADIAFLLLIFFLVTTTMDVNQGINRLLPPIPAANEKPPPIKKRNVLVVLVNSGDQLLVNNKFVEIGDLRREAVDFFTNPENSEDLPEMELISVKIAEAKSKGDTAKYNRWNTTLKVLGEDVKVSKGIISLQNDRGTSYKMYIHVQDELARAIAEVRNDLCMRLWGVKFSSLKEETDPDRIQAIQNVIPAAISEAEPKNIGGQK